MIWHGAPPDERAISHIKEIYIINRINVEHLLNMRQPACSWYKRKSHLCSAVSTCTELLCHSAFSNPEEKAIFTDLLYDVYRSERPVRKSDLIHKRDFPLTSGLRPVINEWRERVGH
jgi:hypothetical protein